MNRPGDSGRNQLPPITSLHMAWTEIEKALQARLYYLALISTLSLIDICSALESENGETDKHKFMAWYEQHLGPHYKWLSKQDCYGLRCGLIHQGVMSHGVKNSKGNPLPPSRWKRIGFLLTEGTGGEMREIATDDVYLTGLSEFCRDVLKRVTEWAVSARQNQIVHKNADKLLHLYPTGHGVCTTVVEVGIPVLA